MIRVKNITKDYGRNKGIFDLSFEVKDGEVFGLMGMQGAGKTIIIRLLMGFVNATRGRCFINGKSCHVHRKAIREFTGYLPEKAALPSGQTGLSFLQFMTNLRGKKSVERALELSDYFQMELDDQIFRMTEEDVQTLKIICAFMHDPDVLILDNPMKDLKSGRENKVLELIYEAKSQKKTVLLTSTRFDVVERSCDRVGMLRRGMLITTDDVADVRAQKQQSYIITFATEQDAMRFVSEEFQVLNISGPQITISLAGEMIPLVKALGNYQVVSLETIEQGLDKLFRHHFGGEGNA